MYGQFKRDAPALSVYTHNKIKNMKMYTITKCMRSPAADTNLITFYFVHNNMNECMHEVHMDSNDKSILIANYSNFRYLGKFRLGLF